MKPQRLTREQLYPSSGAAQFEENLSGKLEDPQFAGDISPLLAGAGRALAADRAPSRRSVEG